MFSAALAIGKKRKQPKCLSTDEWMSRLCSVHAMDYHAAIKMHEALIPGTAWVNLENMRRQRSQTDVNGPVLYDCIY